MCLEIPWEGVHELWLIECWELRLCTLPGLVPPNNHSRGPELPHALPGAGHTCRLCRPLRARVMLRHDGTMPLSCCDGSKAGGRQDLHTAFNDWNPAASVACTDM